MPRSLILISLLIACTPQDLGCQPRDSVEETETLSGAQALPAVVPRADGRVVEHTVRFPSPESHYFEVETVAPASGETLDLMMAVWTPGSYLVREFARHIEDVRASTLAGERLVVRKTRKNRWTLESGAGDLPERVVLRYRIYARELSVRTNFVDADIAVLNGAATFLVPAEELDLQQELAVVLPDEWAEVVTSLEPHPDGEGPEGARRFLARDYDELVDSPIAIGNPSLATFEAGGAEHVVANFGGEGVWDEGRAASDIETIVRAEHEFWGVVPYRRYVFLNLLLEGGGGLEHSASTVMLASRWDSQDEASYRGWLGLVSHEFFHTWNIKRLRPASLGPFDYENENYVHDLWIVEGITSYFDDLLVRRAGLMTESQYYERLTRGISRLQATPGRFHQSLSASSYNAWIRFYRPDENSRNSSVSYYTKGALVAWVLDARIRAATNGQESLDSAMRLAYERFSGERGYTPREIRDLFEEVAGEDLGEFFATHVDGTAEIDYESALRHFGLRFAPAAESDEPEAAYLGAAIDAHSGRLEVTSVVRGGPAAAAGINVGDELLAFGDERLPREIDERLALHRPGDAVELLLSRRGRLRRLTIELGREPEANWSIEVDPDASPGTRRVREDWLGL